MGAAARLPGRRPKRHRSLCAGLCALLVLCALATLTTLAAAQGAAPPPGSYDGAQFAPLSLRVVGGLEALNQYRRHELGFWRDRLPQLTGGRVRADVVPFDRAGIRGQDMLRLMQQGVVPFGSALVSQLESSEPLLVAPDLAGVNADIDSFRNAVDAFRPALSALLSKRYGLELLAVYALPMQVLFCRDSFADLADLTQRRVRVSSVPQADLVAALGAQPLYVPFDNLMPQMRGGQIDCAITGSLSGFAIGLNEVAGYVSELPVNWGMSVFAANAAAWAALPEELRQLLRRELRELEERVFVQADVDSREGLVCAARQRGCGVPSAHGSAATGAQRSRLVTGSSADRQRLRTIAAEHVVPGWARRCGAQCARVWQQLLAPATGIALRPAAAASRNR